MSIELGVREGDAERHIFTRQFRSRIGTLQNSGVLHLSLCPCITTCQIQFEVGELDSKHPAADSPRAAPLNAGLTPFRLTETLRFFGEQ